MVDVNDISFLLQVVVVTHAYGDRSGVRYLTNYLKVFRIVQLLYCYAECIIKYQAPVITMFSAFFCFDHRYIIL